jgi:spore coat protein H
MMKILIVLTSLLLFSCSSGSDNDADSTDTSGEVSAEVSRPDGWTDETHGDDVDPNYDIVFQEGVVGRIDLTIDSTNWQAMLDDMTTLYGTFGTSSSAPGMPPAGGMPTGGAPPASNNFADTNPIWAPCTVQFGDTTWNYVGVRFKGNSSLRDTWGMGNYKLPLRFDFDQFEDDYPAIDDQRFYGFKKLSLSSNFHDDTFIREKVVADLFRDAGVPAPRTAFYRLYVDYGEGATYFGLYTMVEIPDDPMLAQQFSDSSGNLYKPETNLAAYDEDSFDKETNEDEADYSDVLALYNALHSSRADADNWKSGLELVFDVDGFLHWLAITTVIQNWDTYGIAPHNYYLYNDPGDGRLHWIPWDNNESLSTLRREPLPLSLTSGEVGESWPLIRYLMDDDEYWARYVAYVGDTVTDVFQPDRMQAIYAEAHALVEPYTVGDYGEISGYSLLGAPADFYTGLEYLNTHVENRYDDGMEFVAEN